MFSSQREANGVGAVCAHPIYKFVINTYSLKHLLNHKKNQVVP